MVHPMLNALNGIYTFQVRELMRFSEADAFMGLDDKAKARKYRIVPHHITLYHTTPQNKLPCHIMPHHIASHHIIPYYKPKHYAISYRLTSLPRLETVRARALNITLEVGKRGCTCTYRA